MNKLIILLFLLISSRMIFAAADQKITDEQCHTASVEIIKITEKACDIYQDIVKSSTRF